MVAIEVSYIIYEGMEPLFADLKVDMGIRIPKDLNYAKKT